MSSSSEEVSSSSTSDSDLSSSSVNTSTVSNSSGIEDDDKSSTSTISDSSTTKEDKKDVIDPTHISLRVVSSNGEEVFFKIRRVTPLRKLIQVYCERKQTSPSSIKFLFDGNRVKDDDTPDSLGMENNDVIDAMLQQTGGGDDDRYFVVFPAHRSCEARIEKIPESIILDSTQKTRFFQNLVRGPVEVFNYHVNSIINTLCENEFLNFDTYKPIFITNKDGLLKDFKPNDWLPEYRGRVLLANFHEKNGVSGLSYEVANILKEQIECLYY